MATSVKISLSPENTGLWAITQSHEAALVTSELLQNDLDNHHVFLNDVGFHDHMTHHLLALYGTGASVADLQKAYQQRNPLQRPVLPRHETALSDLNSSWDHASKYLGNDEHYPDFLAYFQGVIETRGYESVVNDYLFKGDDAANDLLCRLHAGVLHPLIQLMFGLEWKQPAIIAEALAQTCVHGVERLDELLLEGEQRARSLAKNPKMPELLSLYENLKADPRLSSAVVMEDSSKIEDGILQRAKDPMLAVLEQVHVDPADLEERTAEMFHTMIYVASGAAIRPPHHVKYDFFLIQPWVSESTKVRMLEWKIRMDLVQYAARGCPTISLEAIASYVPKQKSESSLREIGARLHDFGDDGHAIKQARATSTCYELMEKYQDSPWLVLRGEAIWEKIQYMVVDAVEGPGALYIRSAGLAEAWKDIPDQSAPKRDPEVLRSLQTGSGSTIANLELPG